MAHKVVLDNLETGFKEYMVVRDAYGKLVVRIGDGPLIGVSQLATALEQIILDILVERGEQGV